MQLFINVVTCVKICALIFWNSAVIYFFEDTVSFLYLLTHNLFMVQVESTSIVRNRSPKLRSDPRNRRARSFGIRTPKNAGRSGLHFNISTIKTLKSISKHGKKMFSFAEKANQGGLQLSVLGLDAISTPREKYLEMREKLVKDLNFKRFGDSGDLDFPHFTDSVHYEPGVARVIEVYALAGKILETFATILLERNLEQEAKEFTMFYNGPVSDTFNKDKKWDYAADFCNSVYDMLHSLFENQKLKYVSAEVSKRLNLSKDSFSHKIVILPGATLPKYMLPNEEPVFMAFIESRQKLFETANWW